MNIVRKEESSNQADALQAYEAKVIEVTTIISHRAIDEVVRARKLMEEPRQLSVTKEEMDILKSYADLNWLMFLAADAKGFRLYGVEHVVNDKG